MKIDTTCAWCGKALVRHTNGCKNDIHFCNRKDSPCMGLYYQKYGSGKQPARIRNCGPSLQVNGVMFDGGTFIPNGIRNVISKAIPIDKPEEHLSKDFIAGICGSKQYDLSIDEAFEEAGI